MAMGSKAFESPLISHARMRALYRGLVEVRGLAEKLKLRSLRGVEACWVAPPIDLTDGDLVCDTGAAFDSPLVEHVRAIAQRSSQGGLTKATLKRTLLQLRSAPRDTFPGTSEERLVCAVGSAMALQALGGNSVVVAYASAETLNRNVIRLILQPGLPLVVVALPPAPGKSLDLEALAAKTAGSSTSVPVIPVDAGDAVAIYRVMQESIVRARAGGGPAIVSGIACGTDAVALLANQLVRKQICTSRWVETLSTHLTDLITPC